MSGSDICIECVIIITNAMSIWITMRGRQTSVRRINTVLVAHPSLSPQPIYYSLSRIRKYIFTKTANKNVSPLCTSAPCIMNLISFYQGKHKSGPYFIYVIAYLQVVCSFIAPNDTDNTFIVVCLI